MRQKLTQQRTRMAREGRPLSRPTNDPDRVRSLYELASRLGCSYDQAVRLRKDGLITEPDGTFSLSKAAWFLKQRQERSAQHPESTAARSWRERRIKAQALALEHELAARTRGLVSIVDARRAWALQSGKVRTAFSGLGSDLASQLVGRGPQEIEAVITGKVLKILRQLSGEDVSTSPGPMRTTTQGGYT